MVRIITPKGVLAGAVKVSPACEMRNRLNKRMFRTVELADGMDARPNALQVEFALVPTYGNNFLIGNLSTEAVEDIMHKLLTQGYFDFSSLEYQKEVPVEKTVFDAGASRPYVADCACGPGCAMPGANVFGGMPQDDIFGSCRGMCACCDGRGTGSWEESGGSDDEE